MPVAKTYESWEIIEGPYAKVGKNGYSTNNYVKVESPEGVVKEVRFYTSREYYRMYPPKKKAVPQREVLGFNEAGYITIYLGNTYENLSWFKAEPNCRYHKIWGWYTPSDKELPEEIPEGISTAQLTWEKVVDEDGVSVNETKAQDAVNEIKYANVDSTSEYIGEIGDRSDFTLTVKKAISLYGAYGASTMHIMEDKDGNVFVWTTSAKDLEQGVTYVLKGTIKDHKEYRGVKQTVLTRCKVMKESE